MENQPTLLEPYAVYRFPDRAGFLRNELFEAYCFHYLDSCTCEHLILKVEAHIKVHGWKLKRHIAHPTKDIEMMAVESVAPWMHKELTNTIIPTLAYSFNFQPEELVIEDLFFVKYEECAHDGRKAKNNQDQHGCQDRLASHRDGSLLSFNILISDPTSFAGSVIFVFLIPPPLIVFYIEAVGPFLTHRIVQSNLSCRVIF